ncbi:MAG: hypothetical protein JOZ47_14920 [Kutzneria sp.]|nr:hypothetical protein [Kutzneria sp.]
MLEWTPESLKAEIDYRRELATRHARQARLSRQRPRSRPWWSKIVRRHRDDGSGSDPTGGSEHDVAA